MNYDKEAVRVNHIKLDSITDPAVSHYLAPALAEVASTRIVTDSLLQNQRNLLHYIQDQKSFTPDEMQNTMYALRAIRNTLSESHAPGDLDALFDVHSSIRDTFREREAAYQAAHPAPSVSPLRARVQHYAHRASELLQTGARNVADAASDAVEAIQGYDVQPALVPVAAESPRYHSRAGWSRTATVATVAAALAAGAILWGYNSKKDQEAAAVPAPGIHAPASVETPSSPVRTNPPAEVVSPTPVAPAVSSAPTNTPPSSLEEMVARPDGSMAPKYRSYNGTKGIYLSTTDGVDEYVARETLATAKKHGIHRNSLIPDFTVYGNETNMVAGGAFDLAGPVEPVADEKTLSPNDPVPLGDSPMVRKWKGQKSETPQSVSPHVAAIEATYTPEEKAFYDAPAIDEPFVRNDNTGLVDQAITLSREQRRAFPNHLSAQYDSADHASDMLHNLRNVADNLLWDGADAAYYNTNGVGQWVVHEDDIFTLGDALVGKNMRYTSGKKEGKLKWGVLSPLKYVLNIGQGALTSVLRGAGELGQGAINGAQAVVELPLDGVDAVIGKTYVTKGLDHLVTGVAGVGEFAVGTLAESLPGGHEFNKLPESAINGVVRTPGNFDVAYAPAHTNISNMVAITDDNYQTALNGAEVVAKQGGWLRNIFRPAAVVGSWLFGQHVYDSLHDDNNRKTEQPAEPSRPSGRPSNGGGSPSSPPHNPPPNPPPPTPNPPTLGGGDVTGPGIGGNGFETANDTVLQATGEDITSGGLGGM